MPTWYKMRCKLSHGHNMSNIKKHCSIVHVTHNRMEPNFANLVIKNGEIVYEPWHNCNSYGHNIEHIYNG